MKYDCHKGEFFIYPNGTIIRITKRLIPINNKVKVRAVKKCVGKYSSKSRIGKPYTYSFWTSVNALNKRTKRIGTEEILNLLFNRIKVKK